jgi:hypothetical protein
VNLKRFSTKKEKRKRKKEKRKRKRLNRKYFKTGSSTEFFFRQKLLISRLIF